VSGPSDLPAEVCRWLGTPRYAEQGDVAVERGAIHTALAATENGNPLFWDDGVAEALTSGLVAPPSTLSAWYRPHPWAPGRSTPRLPLQVHFDLKDHLELPEAVIADNRLTFLRPLHLGEVVTTQQVLRSVSPEKTTRLGTGRFWEIDVEVRGNDGSVVGVESYTGFGYRRHPHHGAVGRQPGTAPPGPASARSDSDGGRGSSPSDAGAAATGAGGTPRLVVLDDAREGRSLPGIRTQVSATTVVIGALASRDWRPMHHDRDFAVTRNGTRDIFLNTPSQAGWLERLVTDWTGPRGRLGRLRFQMLGSIFPGDEMVLRGVVRRRWRDGEGCGWAELTLEIAVGTTVATRGEATVALPVDGADNPWARTGSAWQP
jgi:acyl dehydratase